MKTKIFATALLILLFTLTIQLSAENNYSDESAWDQAVLIFDEYSVFKPYKMNVYSETYNRKEELEKTEELSYILSYDPNGETESKLIQAIENGIDITEKKRKELEKGSGRGGPGSSSEKMEGMDKIPLDPEVQKDVTAVDTGLTEYKNNKKCSVWEFTIQLNDKYKGIGTAWINAKTGEAVSLSYSFEPLFPFVENMSLILDFETDSEELWYLERLKMEGSINMLIIKKRFDSITTFSDYR